MVRSLSFGSYIYNFKSILKLPLTYFRLLYHIKLAININLLAHYAKGTLSPLKKASTDCLHYILGSFNAKKVLFHLSLTVLTFTIDY